VDEKLIRRFVYESDGTQLLNGRPAYVLEFSPVADPVAEDRGAPTVLR
jgi:hypothetical protein